MPRSFWTPEEDAIVLSRYAEETCDEIARRLPGRTAKAVSHRSRALGLSRSPSEVGTLAADHWERTLADKLGMPIADWLQKRYVTDGATYRDLTAEANINTRSLMRLMRKYAIRPVSPSEAAKRSMAADPQFIARLHKSAGTNRAFCNRAKFREDNWEQFETQHERTMRLELMAHGLCPISEMAVDRFNIDLALPNIKLAIELDPRWHDTPRKREVDARKDALLSSRGWVVLRLQTRASTEYNVSRVLDAVSALACRHPSNDNS